MKYKIYTVRDSYPPEFSPLLQSIGMNLLGTGSKRRKAGNVEKEYGTEQIVGEIDVSSIQELIDLAKRWRDTLEVDTDISFSASIMVEPDGTLLIYDDWIE